MTSNSAAMSLEERLVQHIKDTGLGILINDEDAITQLTRRAVDQAFLQPRRVSRSYGGYDERDSPAVEAGRKIAAAAAEAIVQKMTEELIGNIEFRKALVEAFVTALPQAVSGYASGFVSSSHHSAAAAAMQHVQEMARQGLLGRT